MFFFGEREQRQDIFFGQLFLVSGNPELGQLHFTQKMDLVPKAHGSQQFGLPLATTKKPNHAKFMALSNTLSLSVTNTLESSLCLVCIHHQLFDFGKEFS